MNIYVSEFKPKKADYILASRWCLDQNQNHIPILAYNFTEYSNTAEYAIGDIVRASVPGFGWAFYKARQTGTLSAPQNHTTADWEFIEMVYPTIPAGKIFKLPANPDDYADHDLYFTNKTAIDTFGKGMFMDPGQSYLKTPAYDGDEYVSPSYGAYNIAIPYGMTLNNQYWAPLIGEKAQMTFDQAPTSRLPDAKMNESLWVNTYKPADGEYFTCETPYKQIPVGICTDYISLVWNDKLYETGDFQLTLIDTPDNRKLFKNGRWIQIPNSDRVMIIEKIEFNAALKSDGYLMNVSGRGLSSILDRRVSFPGLSLNTSECTKDGGFVYGIERLVEAYFIDPTIPIATNNLNQNPDFYYPERHISCLKIGRDYREQFPDLNPTAGTNNVPHTSINRTVSNEVVLETIQEACSKSNIGFRIDIEHDNTYDCDWLIFKLYQGQKRLYNTDHPLIFSSKMNNVDSVAVTTDSTEYKNFFFCGKEKDADSYIDFAATQTVDPSSMVGQLINKSKAATSISNWVKTNLQDNDITRTAIMFIAIAAWRADNGGDQTILSIEKHTNNQWEDYDRDSDGLYVYPTKIISGEYRIKYKKIVGGSSSNPDGYFYTNNNENTPDGWVESFKLSTAYGWLTTDFLKEAKAQAKAKIATGIVGYAKYSAMNAWFSNMDRYTSTYSQVKWLCGTHSTGEPGTGGLDRREQFVEEEQEEDKDWDTSDILSWKQQTSIVKVGQDKDEESDEDIVKRLTTSAIKQSGQYRQKHDVDVKCNSDITKYRVDYNLGDIVQVDDEHGTIESYMITEVAIANDTSKGEQAIPTFQKYSRIPSQYTELEYLAVSNMILPVVFNEQPNDNKKVDTESVKNGDSHLVWQPDQSEACEVFSISGYSDQEFIYTDFETEFAHILNPKNAQTGILAPLGTIKSAIISADGCEINNGDRVRRDYPLLIVRDFYNEPSGYNTKHQLNAAAFKTNDHVYGQMRLGGLYSDIRLFDSQHMYYGRSICIVDKTIDESVTNPTLYICTISGAIPVHGTWEEIKNSFTMLGTCNAVSMLCDTVIDEGKALTAELRDRPGLCYKYDATAGKTVLETNSNILTDEQFTKISGLRLSNNFHIITDLKDSSDNLLGTLMDRVPYRNKINLKNINIRTGRVGDSSTTPLLDIENGTVNTGDCLYAGSFTSMNDLIKLYNIYKNRLGSDNWMICKYTGSLPLYGYVIQQLNIGTDDTQEAYNTSFFISKVVDDKLTGGHITNDTQVGEVLQHLCNTCDVNGNPMYNNMDILIHVYDPNSIEQRDLNFSYIARTRTCLYYDSNMTYTKGNHVMFGDTRYQYTGETDTSQSPAENQDWHAVGTTNVTYGLRTKLINTHGNPDQWYEKNSTSEYQGANESVPSMFMVYGTSDMRYKSPITTGDYICFKFNKNVGNIETAFINRCEMKDYATPNDWKSITDYRIFKYLVRSQDDDAPMKYYPDIKAANAEQTNIEELFKVWKDTLGATGIRSNTTVPYEKIIVNPAPNGTYVQDFRDIGFFKRYIVLGGYRRRKWTDEYSTDYEFDRDFTDAENGYAFKTLKFYESRAVNRYYEVMGCDPESLTRPDGASDVLPDGRIDPAKFSQLFCSQLIDTETRKQTHEFVPVKYNGADGDDYANLRDVDKYGFYDVDEQRFIPINFSPDGTENRAAKFCSAGPELVQNT